jgi:hypothetical protein
MKSRNESKYSQFPHSGRKRIKNNPDPVDRNLNGIDLGINRIADVLDDLI